MKSGKTAGHGNGHPSVPNRTQAKRAGPKLEAGPEASAERSEGTMEARMGRDAAGGSMRYAHDSATGHVSWPGTPGFQGSMHKLIHQASGSRASCAGDCCGLADPAVFEGRQASRGGDGPEGFPLEASAAHRQGREGITPSRQGAGWILQPASTAKSSSGSSAYHAHTTPKARWAGRTR